MALPQRVIVTGAAQGIGRAVALHVASPGVYLAVWDVKRDGVEETAKLCHEKGAAARAWIVDVGDADAIEAAVAAFERAWGTPDGLVNNAGIFPRARSLDMKLAEWEEVLRVNLTGTFVTARTVAARMKDLGRGAIVNTASGRALAGAAYGIRVNCVIPGLTDTAQPRVEMGDNELYAAGARIPMGRIGRPEDIAAVVAFLLSDDSGYMTGQSVAANGGAIMVP